MSDPTAGNNKAVAAVLSGSAVIVLTWILDVFFHVQIPTEVSASFQTIFVTMFVWFVPHGDPQT